MLMRANFIIEHGHEYKESRCALIKNKKKKLSPKPHKKLHEE